MNKYGDIAAKGAIWNVTLAAVNKGVTLLGQIVLAWLLTPADMGLAGMAIAMVSFTAFISAGGVSDVLIQRNRYEKEAAQGFWISIVLCLFTTLLVAALVPIAIYWMGRKDLTGLLLILALCNLAWFANPILEAKLKHLLDFKHLSIALFLSGVSYTGFSIFFAFLGWGPYALIWSRLIQNLVPAIYILFLKGWIPFEFPRLAVIKELVRPTFMMSLTGFLGGLQTQVPVFCVGLLLSPTSTGHFAWGWAIASQAVFLLASNLRHVLLPVFSKMGGEPERQISAVVKCAKAMTALLVITCGLQALLAGPLLNFFSPTKWQAAGTVIMWVSLGLSLQGVWVAVTAWLNANGRYDELLLCNAVPAVFGGLFSFAGAYFGGLDKAAIGAGFGIALGAAFSLKFFPNGIVQKNSKTFFAPLALCAAIWLAGYFFSPENLWLKALTSGLFVVGGAVSWWYWDDGTLRKIVPQLVVSKSGYVGEDI